MEKMVRTKKELKDFYAEKKVLVTGHTGFKGTWLTLMLNLLGARVVGYSLMPNAEPSLFKLVHFRESEVKTYIGDIRDFDFLKEVIKREQPQYVVHMAAQPIVRESYADPRYTFETNVMGTVNLMECLRNCDSVKSILNVTTDKVYLNTEKEIGYKESDPLDGYDPYSNSKSCSELVTHAYSNSFFKDRVIPVSTARAGNVIGGGDFEKDRIIPDCVRAMLKNEPIIVRNPNSIRPYQHVIEALYAYLLILSNQEISFDLQGAYNVGPKEKNICKTGELVDIFCRKWKDKKVMWKTIEDHGPHEATILKLDSSKMTNVFGWNQKWNIDKTMDMIVEWTRAFLYKQNIRICMEEQIESYLSQE